MKSPVNRIALLLSLTSVSVALSGCFRKTESVAAKTDGNTTIGVVDDALGFSMKVCKGDSDYSGYPQGSSLGTCSSSSYFFHQEGDRTKGCAVADISSSAPWSTRNITCIAEAYELDLWSDGIKMAFNVPRTVCEYVRFSPYWYWSFKPGNAPPTATAYRNSAGCVGGSAPPSADGTTHFIDPQTCQVVCGYNYSSLASGAPNCCEGGTILTTITTDDQGNVTTSTSYAAQSGSRVNCAAGPGKDAESVDRLPIPEILSGTDGVNTAFNVKKSASAVGGLPYTFYSANYIRPADHQSGRPAGLQAFLGSLPEKDYVLECLDEAAEVKARITVKVRDWNRKTDFDAYVAGSTGDAASDSNANSGGNLSWFFSTDVNDGADSITLVTGGTTGNRKSYLSVGMPVSLRLLNPQVGVVMPGGLSEYTQYVVRTYSATQSDDTGSETLELEDEAGNLIDITSAGSNAWIAIYANDYPDLESPKNDMLDWKDFGQEFPEYYEKD